MSTIYISIILLCRVVQHLFTKRASGKINDLACFLKYNAYCNFISATLGLLFIIMNGKGFRCDTMTLIISVFSGSMLALSSGLGLASLKTGTVALTAMFGTAGILIPCIAGIFLFDKQMSLFQWLGILIFIIAAYFLISDSQKIHIGFSWKTLLLLVGILLAEGFTMLSQQMFAYYVPDGDVSVFSFLAFSILGIVMLIASFTFPKSQEIQHSKRFPKQLWLFGAILATAVFIINQLATLSASLVSPVVLFTFINGGSTVIGAIVAAVCFHEKLTLRNSIGIFLGVLALIIIKAF